MHFRALLATALAAFTVGWSDEIADERPRGREGHADVFHPEKHAPIRTEIRGTAFPEGVLALTWDDGPDAGTLALARWLHDRRVTGTFFVVRAWENGVSEEPGRGHGGTDPFLTGYAHLPILGDLVALGHRLGNHTDGHVLLYDLPMARVVEQVGRAQAALDPFLSNELRLFRAPGGYFSDVASSALDTPAFASTLGPIRWDIDEKDWSASLDGIPARVVAARYLATIERLKRGIVLLHDRVGDVGSPYALDLARALVPALEARGYVFAAPVLAFTRFEDRLDHVQTDPMLEPHRIRLVDVDGDGRADLCAERDGSVLCSRARAPARADGALPRTAFSTFDYSTSATSVPKSSVSSALADIDGDGRADLCFLRDSDIACARTTHDGGFGPIEPWSSNMGSHGDAGATLRLADVDGDGRADACVSDGGHGIVCGSSTGASFTATAARTWLEARVLDSAHVALADVDGDGRADACSAGVCALSTGRAFGAPRRWSSAKELASAGEVRFGDLNGDGRADVCSATSSGIACAFSNGRSFTAPTLWLDRPLPSFELADINADGRVDLCAVVDGTLRCGLAP